MKKACLMMIASIAAISACRNAQEAPVTGNLTIHEGFPSKHVESRALRVWTPENYDPSVRYDVIYMHDGRIFLIHPLHGTIRSGESTRCFPS